MAGQVHKVDLIELAALGVQKVHALPLGDDAELLRHTGGFLHTALAHDGVVEALFDTGRGHHQNVGGLGTPAVHALALEDEVIDLLIIMLGTDDVKERFGANAACIAAAWSG